MKKALYPLLFLASLLGAETIDLTGRAWEFTPGREFPGATGEMTSAGEGAGRVITVTSDFTQGGNYTGILLRPEPPLNLRSLEFDIVSPAKHVAVQVTDSRDQTFVRFLPLSGAPDARQRITIDRFFVPGERTASRWGGPNDGVVRPPFKMILLRTLKSSYGDVSKPRSIHFSAIRGEAGEAPAKVAPTARVIDPARLVTAPGGEAVPFQLNGPWDGEKAAYQLYDYAGKEIATGEVAIKNGRFELPVPVKEGFYEYRLPLFNLTAGMVALPPFAGERDDFFAIDAAMSVFPVYKDVRLAEAYLAILKHAGIGHVRERLIWREVEKEAQGNFRFDVYNSDGLRKLAAKYDQKVLDVFHDAPLWSGATHARQAAGFYPFPRDLVRTAASWAAIGERWSPYWDGLEIWNEPEIAFGATLPGDQVGALQRAISYEFAARNIPTPVISGVFTGSVVNDRMMRLYLGNGLLADADRFSFHCYASAGRMQRLVADFRHALRGDAKANIPFLITECGMPWPVGTPRAGLNEDLDSGMHIAMKAVEAKANGVAMYYPFILQFYEEHAKNFGMMDKFHTPMRSLAAYFQTVRLLSGYRYAGDLPAVAGGQLSRVFAKGNSALLVVYTGNQRTAVTLPQLPLEALGADGRKLAPAREYLERDGMLYFRFGLAALKPHLKSDTEAMRLLELAESWKPQPRLAKPVVPQYDFDRPSTTWTLYGYMYNDPAQALFPVVYNNLSGAPLTVKPELTLPPGVKLLEAPPATLTLPPKSRTEIRFSLDLSGGYAKAPELDIVLRDQAGNADQLLIGVRNWNLEVAEAAAGLNSARPQNFAAVPADWIRLDSPERWKKWEGGHLPNIRAAFQFSYSPDTLQLLVLVEDRKFHQPNTIDQAWRADSIQIGLQTLSKDGERKHPFTEITAAQTPQGPKIYLHSSENAPFKQRGELKTSTLEFKPTPEGMLYLIQLDTKELSLPTLTPETRLGAALLVNSSEGKQRDGYLHWGDGIGENKNPREFNVIKLR